MLRNEANPAGEAELGEEAPDDALARELGAIRLL